MKESKAETMIDSGSLHWRPSNLMKIPNADILERTGSKMLGARLWQLPPQSANTLHRHITSEEFFFVLEGTGRIRVDGQTYTIKKHEGIHVWPDQMRQVFNDTEETVLWLITGAPDNEVPKGETPDLTKFYPSDPKQLPPELAGVCWPPDQQSDQCVEPGA
jgi:quercetin dioxygenase-like cupin family protein